MLKPLRVLIPLKTKGQNADKTGAEKGKEAANPISQKGKEVDRRPYNFKPTISKDLGLDWWDSYVHGWQGFVPGGEKSILCLFV